MQIKTISYQEKSKEELEPISASILSSLLVSFLVKVSLVIITAVLLAVILPVGPEGSSEGAAQDDLLAARPGLSIALTDPVEISRNDDALYSTNPELMVHHRYRAARNSARALKQRSANPQPSATHLIDNTRH
jgi:hypothetical protein